MSALSGPLDSAASPAHLPRVEESGVDTEASGPAPYQAPPDRAIADNPATRKAIYTRVLDSFKNLGPIQAGNYSLTLDDLDYEDPEEVSLKDKKRAILRGDTLSRRIRGVMTLSDQAGKVVDQRTATVARVPHLTDQGTYVLSGVEHSLANQVRLHPGAFTRVKENGERHVNPNRGLGHRLQLDPETGVFRIEIGQARIPLLPLLRTLGFGPKARPVGFEDRGPERARGMAGRAETAHFGPKSGISADQPCPCPCP